MNSYTDSELINEWRKCLRKGDKENAYRVAAELDLRGIPIQISNGGVFLGKEA